MKKQLLLMLLFAGNMVAAQTNRAFVTDSLDAYVNKALADWKIPGVAICIVKDGKTVFTKGYGVRESGVADKVDENTLFMIGSNTKAFTGTALAMLHASKKISLNDPVIKWLRDFKLYDPWVTKEANIVDLLSHRLGFETFQGDFMYFDSDITAAEVRRKFGMLKPLYSFRSKWGYCNAAFGVAGDIIPKVTGKTWSQFITDSIFKPLQMDRTVALSKDIAKMENRATAHTVADGVLKKIAYGNIDNLAPAGSITSSVNDLSNWVQALLNNGSFNNRQVIPEAAIALAQRPWSILGNGGVNFNTGHFALYGLGWMLQEYNGKKIVAHTGGVNGFVTSVTLVPEEKLGIVVLTNTDANSFYEALKWELLDVYMQLPYRNYSDIFLQEYHEGEAEAKKNHEEKIKLIAQHPQASFPVENIVGTYVHPIYGSMKITKEQAKYLARFEHHKNRFAELNPLGGATFYAEFNEALYGRNEWVFKVEKGIVKSVTVRVADFVEFTPYEFVKKTSTK